MSRLIVYAGANGAGKSTLREGGSDPVEVEIDPDRIARRINPVAPRSVDFEAGKEALRQIDAALQAGRSLSLETTLTGRTVLMRMQAAKDAGYDVTLRYVAVGTADINVKRVDARAAAGGHWIDPATVRRRVGNSLDNLPAAIAIADRSTLLDNTGQSHRTVLRVENGRISFQAASLPEWLAQRLPQIAAELARLQPTDHPAGMTPHDPFGDRATRGYLRNRMGTNDLAAVARLEAQSFAENVLGALDRLAISGRPDYAAVLETHKLLFQSVYPWAGQDRAALGIGTAGVADRFALPGDVRRATEQALVMGNDPDIMRGKPGEVFGRLAKAHPFLDGNGRALMAVHADLARRAGIHFDWSAVGKQDFMRALSAELRAPGAALDDLLKPALREGALPISHTASVLQSIAGVNRRGSSPSP